MTEPRRSSSTANRSRQWRPCVTLLPKPSPPIGRQAGLLACLLFAIALAACSAPVKVERVDLRTAYEDLNRTALSSDQLSETTRTVLRRAALLDTFDAQPDAAIAALRAQAIATGMHWPDLYALSEMSYYEGRRTKSKPMLLASALYAYAVLFPTGDADKPSPYSAQFQHATNFYNLALTQVLSGAGAEGVATLQSGRYDAAVRHRGRDRRSGQPDVRRPHPDLVRADDEPDGGGLQERLPQRRPRRAARRRSGAGTAAGHRPRAAAEPARPDLGRAADGRPAPATHRVRPDRPPCALHDL